MNRFVVTVFAFLIFPFKSNGEVQAFDGLRKAIIEVNLNVLRNQKPKGLYTFAYPSNSIDRLYSSIDEQIVKEIIGRANLNPEDSVGAYYLTMHSEEGEKTRFVWHAERKKPVEVYIISSTEYLGPTKVKIGFKKYSGPLASWGATFTVEVKDGNAVVIDVSDVYNS